VEEGWLDGEQASEFVEVIDGEGQFLGWISRKDAGEINLIPQIIETPDRYLKDPYVTHHATLIEERQLFKDGRDLNDVQLVLLSSAIINRRKRESERRDVEFEQSMAIGNPDMYRAYIDKKKQTEEADGGVSVEQRVPGSVEEFLATLAAFGAEEGSDSDKEQENAEGWLASFLSDDDLNQMQDD
jgi:hypothetical protein